MNLEDSPSFHLRRDFAFEIGYFAEIHEPLSEAEFARRSATAGLKFSIEEFRENNRLRCCYPGPPIVYFGGMILPGETTPVPFVTDAKYRFHPEQRGLFEATLERARVAAGCEPGIDPFLFPNARKEGGPAFVLPKLVIMHDPEIATAQIVPIKRADHLARARNARFWPCEDSPNTCGTSPGPGDS